MRDKDTGRDPALYPVAADRWKTREGEIRVRGAIHTRNKNGRDTGPFVAYDLEGRRWIVTPANWRKLMTGADLIESTEDLLRAAGVTPKWGGPPQ